jgi:phosphoribosyl-ATP pyrophosphohydrolase
MRICPYDCRALNWKWPDMAKKVAAKPPKPVKIAKKTGPKGGKKATKAVRAIVPPSPAIAVGSSPAVLDRLYTVVLARRNANPEVSHSARLLARGTAKIAQKFGEEAVECLIEAVAGNTEALVGESADVLYHMMVMWVDAGVEPGDVWTELQRREGVSGIAEKASRVRKISASFGTKTTKIP